ncbi:MAG: ribosome biogenesis GTP-binding protein YihA/YsxC [Bacteroidota bacterium]|nr:ribosome biogenesis GTP-binding protein YihA/YsxC [Bacteroidota bacterium]MDP4232786.1 ribosome biogenesis GTP-binding protein YihA/YsxC [Bacteroidota bacterium]MDP4242533.1 ribosome biogenesis GTP-binding protein YihA/YsxC [Bacteroidota bacterium]MDP4288888.1 ribosome biogenesis GTP-binding protein YihA/YsxC [Bacteroidota bacterium]
MSLSASFVRSVAQLEDCPADGLAEVALTGRSNVGKSSLINALTNRKQLARTSGTPGKTQVLNYFLIGKEYYLVDMPGYGYARRAKTERAKWARLIESYLLTNTRLRAVGVLIDARHSLMSSDREAMQWLQENSVPFFVVLTKSDHAKQRDLASLKSAITSEFGSERSVLATSSRLGRGIAPLREFIKKSALSSDE